MEPGTPPRAIEAKKSVVVVSDIQSPDNYCIGFVAVADAPSETSRSKTFIVAPSSFLEKMKDVTISFFDGRQFKAKVVHNNSYFSLLTTRRHRGCVQVSWMEPTSPLLTPAATFTLSPESSTRTAFESSFAVVESAESFLVNQYTISEVDSRNYFLVSCEHFDCAADGKSKLIGAPVFTMDDSCPTNCAMGVVCMDHGPRSEIKLALTAACFKEILAELGCPEPRSVPRRKLKKIKRQTEQTSSHARKKGKKTEQNREEKVEEDPEANREEEVEEDPEANREEEVEDEPPALWSVSRRKRKKIKRPTEQASSLPRKKGARKKGKKTEQASSCARKKGKKTEQNREEEVEEDREAKEEEVEDEPPALSSVLRRKRRKIKRPTVEASSLPIKKGDSSS